MLLLIPYTHFQDSKIGPFLLDLKKASLVLFFLTIIDYLKQVVDLRFLKSAKKHFNIHFK